MPGGLARGRMVAAFSVELAQNRGRQPREFDELATRGFY
jgi:hypothetical protein